MLYLKKTLHRLRTVLQMTRSGVCIILKAGTYKGGREGEKEREKGRGREGEKEREKGRGREGEKEREKGRGREGEGARERVGGRGGEAEGEG